MQPRRDGDTRPVLLGAQIIPRTRTDTYGRTTGQNRTRGPVAVRNGLPATRPYRYRGTGQSLTQTEAARKLTWRETPS